MTDETLQAMEEITPFSGEEFVNAEAQSLPVPSMPMMQAKTQFITAIKVQEPRRIAKVTKNVLAEAKLAKKSFYYAWPVKTKDGKMKRIEGPSIDLAMCLARNYGNAALDIEVSETPTHYIFKGYFIDLETGFTVPRLYRQRKSQSIGEKYDKDRQEDIVFQIGHSKAQRNAIIKAMPNWLIEQAIEVAKQAEIAEIQTNPHLARAKVLEFFEEYGIDAERIERFFGKKVDQLTTKDIEMLRATAKAVKDGQISPEEAFAVEDKDDKAKDMEKKLKEKLEGKENGEKPQRPVPQSVSAATANEDQQQQEQEQTPTDEINWDAWVSEWINLRTSKDPNKGFMGYVNKNLVRFLNAPEAIQKQAKRKWQALYPDEPWPLDVATAAPEDQQTNKETQVDERPTLQCPESGDSVLLTYCDEACPHKAQCAAYKDYYDKVTV